MPTEFHIRIPKSLSGPEIQSWISLSEKNYDKYYIIRQHYNYMQHYKYIFEVYTLWDVDIYYNSKWHKVCHASAWYRSLFVLLTVRKQTAKVAQSSDDWVRFSSVHGSSLNTGEQGSLTRENNLCKGTEARLRELMAGRSPGRECEHRSNDKGPLCHPKGFGVHSSARKVEQSVVRKATTDGAWEWITGSREIH